MKDKFTKLQGLLQSLVGVLVLCTILIVTTGVVSRLMKMPASWTDEMLRIIFVWLVFIMSAVGYHCDELIGLDLLEDMLKSRPRSKAVLKFVQSIFGVVFAIFMMVQTFQLVVTQIGTRELTPVMSFPLWLQTLGYFLGCAMFSVFAIYKIYIRAKELKKNIEKRVSP